MCGGVQSAVKNQLNVPVNVLEPVLKSLEYLMITSALRYRSSKFCLPIQGTTVPIIFYTSIMYPMHINLLVV